MVDVGKNHIYGEENHNTEQYEGAELGLPQHECDGQGLVLSIIKGWLQRERVTLWGKTPSVMQRTTANSLTFGLFTIA